MSGRIKKWKLWGEMSLISAAAVPGILLFCSVISLLEGEPAENIFPKLSLVALLGGMVILLIVACNLFQVYFPVLLSMGATRKAIVRTFLLNLGMTVLLLTALIGLFWKLLPGDLLHASVASEGSPLSRTGILPLGLVAGGFLLAAAFGMAVGAIMTRWRKTGAIILIVVCMTVGFLFGLSVALHGGVFGPEQSGQMSGKAAVCLFVFAAGLAAYLAAGLFALAVIRKAEMRM